VVRDLIGAVVGDVSDRNALPRGGLDVYEVISHAKAYDEFAAL
jgi:hypothetical protein